MEYPASFILLYLSLQALFVVCGYFYYEKFIKRLYLSKQNLPASAGFSQLLVFLCHSILLYLPYSLYGRWPEITVGNAQYFMGLGIAGLGFVILISGFIALKAIRHIMGLRSDRLIRNGIYKLTRNPQITGYGILIISFIIIWPSWYAVVSFFAYAIVAHKMVRTEESHLKKRFGDMYRQYQKRTRRYL